MAAIRDRLVKQIKAAGGDAKGVQTISQAIKALGGVRKGEDIATAVDSSTITASDPNAESGGLTE